MAVKRRVGITKAFKKRASVYNFAISRGFEPEIINRALKEIEKDEN